MLHTVSAMMMGQFFQNALQSSSSSSTSDASAQTVVQVKERLSIAGRIQPQLELLKVSPTELQLIWTNLRSQVHVVDVILFLILGFCTIPLGKIVYHTFERPHHHRRIYDNLKSKRPTGTTTSSATTTTTTNGVQPQHNNDNGNHRNSSSNNSHRENHSNTTTSGGTSTTEVISAAAKATSAATLSSSSTSSTTTRNPASSTTSSGTSTTRSDDYYYERSMTFCIAVLIQQVARLAVLVYLFDCTLIVMEVLGVTFYAGSDPSGDFCRVVYFTWATLQFIQFKRYLLGLAVNRKSHALGKVVVMDRILDVLIYACWSLGILDTVKIQIGPGLASLFTFGGVGTIVFGMASKDMATQIVSGITLTTSEKFHIGEDVRLGDGTRGIVESMGWLYTEVRGFDEIIIQIPNSQIAGQRVSNFSRLQKCRVRVALRFGWQDYDKIEAFCTKVKEELLLKCQYLITDGTRPFRANWTKCESDHLQVVVDTHHNLRPVGTRFLNNQQLVYHTIFQVAQESDISFVIPSYHVVQSTSASPTTCR